jgi:hypothetical protein
LQESQLIVKDWILSLDRVLKRNDIGQLYRRTTLSALKWSLFRADAGHGSVPYVRMQTGAARHIIVFRLSVGHGITRIHMGSDGLSMHDFTDHSLPRIRTGARTFWS